MRRSSGDGKLDGGDSLKRGEDLNLPEGED